LLEDDSDENENKDDEVFVIREVAGKPLQLRTKSMDSLFFDDLGTLLSSFASVSSRDLFLRLACQWFFTSESALPSNSAAIADHLRPMES